MRRALVVLVALLLSACTYEVPMPDSAANDLPPLAEALAEPRLALAEHLLAEYFASDIASPPTVCLAVSEGGAEAALPAAQETELIARFPRLAPFARCTRTAAGWHDRASEQPALVFTIHSFACASEIACEGWAGYTAGATASLSSLYRMAYEGGRWTFERDRRLIME